MTLNKTFWVKYGVSHSGITQYLYVNYAIDKQQAQNMHKTGRKFAIIDK